MIKENGKRFKVLNSEEQETIAAIKEIARKNKYNLGGTFAQIRQMHMLRRGKPWTTKNLLSLTIKFV